MPNKNEIEMMIQVSRLYYDSGLTQQQIAAKLAITRQRVSRLLVAAREEGIVRITIYDPTPEDPDLKTRLIEKFGLREVVLTSGEGLNTGLLRTQLGLVAADFLGRVMVAGSVVGLGWGRTLYEVVNSLPRHARQIPVHVVPVIGGTGDMSPYFQVNDLARRFAEAFNGSFRYIYAPAFTQDQSLLESLARSQEIEQLADLWKRLDIAVVGIGHVEFQQVSSMYFSDPITPRAMGELVSLGAVGDICGRFYNDAGEAVTGRTGVIGISLEELSDIPEVVAITGGVEKTRALAGALRGGYIKTLVTDTATARAVLAESNE